MQKFARPLILLAVVMLIVAGCQNQPPIAPQAPISSDLTQLGLPGVTLDSAIFSIYVGAVTNQTVNVHRITADWAENVVTWNSFGGAYDPTIVGSFTTDATGWKTVNVSSLVQAWIDGVYPNYGLLIEQGQTNGSVYPSSEYASVSIRPMLTICYTTMSGQTCVTMQRGANGNVADTYIWAIFPNDNHGTADRLFTGLISGYEKQSLLKFDMPTFPELAAIGNFVWYDTNMNGIQDAGELGVTGVTVHLFDCAGNMVATDTTDADGLYLFEGLQPGDYYVHFVLPDGHQFSPQDQGSDDALDSDADISAGRTICTTLDAGETDLTWDAGIFRVEEGGCTRTIGYWKTHAGFGPQPDMVTALLPIWLGASGGAKSLNVTTAAMAVDVLSQDVYGRSSNGITKLYAQLLGAKLNGANGADLSDVAATIAAADVFLATHDYNDWRSLSNADKSMVLGWKDMLDDYNNGLIGPIHCD